jgi:hypothetical protein
MGEAVFAVSGNRILEEAMKTALRALSALLLSAPSLALAATYPVEIGSQMNGLDIKVLASSGTPLVITFVSKEKADARCKAEIASGLDAPQDRTVTAKAGKSTAIPFTLISTPNRVRVKATCVPSSVKSGAKP